jgi:hypothetical protein
MEHPCGTRPPILSMLGPSLPGMAKATHSATIRCATQIQHRTMPLVILETDSQRPITYRKLANHQKFRECEERYGRPIRRKGFPRLKDGTKVASRCDVLESREIGVAGSRQQVQGLAVREIGCEIREG